MALTWVPLTAHCRIEVMSGFELLRCSTEPHESKEGGDPCKETGCCSIESAQYQALRQHEIAPALLVAIVPAENHGVAEQSLPAEVSLGVLTAAPPELSTCWQFSLRAALPVRAPSPTS